MSSYWKKKHCTKWCAGGAGEIDSYPWGMQTPVVEIRKPLKVFGS